MKQKWDDAGNLLWQASGTGGISNICCEEYMTASEKVNYACDALNRLRSPAYGDGNPSITRTYTPEGLAGNHQLQWADLNHQLQPAPLTDAGKCANRRCTVYD